MLESLIVLLVLIYFLGWIGPTHWHSIPDVGGFIHLLLIVIVALVLLRIFGGPRILP